MSSKQQSSSLKEKKKKTEVDDKLLRKTGIAPKYQQQTTLYLRS